MNDKFNWANIKHTTIFILVCAFELSSLRHLALIFNFNFNNSLKRYHKQLYNEISSLETKFLDDYESKFFLNNSG